MIKQLENVFIKKTSKEKEPEYYCSYLTSNGDRYKARITKSTYDILKKTNSKSENDNHNFK